MPRDISAAFRNLANAYEMMRASDGNVEPSNSQDELLGRLVASLMESAEDPPAEVEGVSDEFIEQLERVPKKKLREDMSCPICGNPFLEGMMSISFSHSKQSNHMPDTDRLHFIDTHPLVVRLPCHKDHIFDLECIQPWIKLNPTCPMDRQKLIKKKPEPPPKLDDDEDGEYDDMFG